MVGLSIAGSAYWRPEARTRETLPLGGTLPVRHNAPAAGESISSVLEMVAPSVAFLTIPELTRSGSGVVVHEAGFVVTNAHVVAGIEGEQLLVAFDDGEQYEAVVYGVDRATDLAVVKVDAGRALQAAPLGDSDALQVGEFVVAIGAPFGLQATATSGIVSGLHRSGLGIARFEDFIVTDAPINRGNSGGPLVNLRGEVVGINTAIIADENDPHSAGTFAGVGFAIPVNVMRVVAQRLIGDGGAELFQGGGTNESHQGEAAGSNGSLSQAPRGAEHGGFGLTVAGPAPSRQVDARQHVPGQMAESIALVQPYDDSGRGFPHGSGFVISIDGQLYAVTNEHVVRGARHIELFFPSREGRGYFSIPGVLRADDEGRDLALIELPADERLRALRVGDADALRMGDEVSSEGARIDARGVVIARHSGHVTETGLTGWTTYSAPPWAHLLTTDLEVEKGDSGGPLLDEAGAVVGVVFARERSAGDDARRSFAVVFRVDHELELLVDPGLDTGAGTRIPPDQPEIRVHELEPGGLAASVWGLQLGDRIVAIDGEQLPQDAMRRNEIWEAFLRSGPGSSAVLLIEREDGNGNVERASVTVQIPDPSHRP